MAPVVADDVALPAATRRWAIAASCVGLALVAVHASSRPGAVQDWSYLVVGTGASVAAWIGALRGDRHLVGGLIAIGVTLTALGDTINQVLVWTRPVGPDVSLADVGWVLSYVVLIAAMLLFLRRGSVAKVDLDGWIDLAAVSVVAILVQWEVSVRALASDATLPPIVKIVWILYPTLDIVLLVLVARALLSAQLRSRTAVCLSVGILCWLLADVAFTVMVPDGHLDTRIDVGWLLGSIALAAAAWAPRQAPPEQARSAGARVPQRAHHGGVLVALVPLAVPGLVDVVGTGLGGDPEPITVFAATVVLLGLAVLRTLRISGSDHAAHVELQRQEALAVAVAATSSDATILIGPDLEILNSPAGVAALLGLDAEGFGSDDLLEAIVEDDRGRAMDMFRQALETPGRIIEGDLRVQHADGRILWIGVREVSRIDDPDVGAIVATLHDITARRRAQDELGFQALHDGLTGLANRTLLVDRLQRTLDGVTRTGLLPALVFLDLDGFKTVNDTLGHGAGDELLCEVGRRLVGAVRAVDTVARLGGDEFAILIAPSEWPLRDAEEVAERVLCSLRVPVVLDEQVVQVSASLGLAGAEVHASAASMLRDADMAMYQAKAAGKGRWVAFDGAVRAAAVERLQLETDLAHAMAEGQLALVYQPIVRLGSGQVVGFEALVRWCHPTLGIVQPDQFIPIAEENGLMVEIGAWVLDEACATAARWHLGHPEHAALTMAVNVSARQLASGDIVEHVQGALARSGLDPTTLVVELTETMLIRDPEAAADSLRRVSALGVRIAIDDFGTGFSSLSHLRLFPLDILKIDRSFISTISDAAEVPAIVHAVLGLAHTLDLETVAEGVELEVQRDWLRSASCDLAQGFLFGRPVDATDAEALLLRQPPSLLPGVVDGEPGDAARRAGQQ